MSVLYITQNGVTDHIGQSQVVPYLLGLADKGFTIHLLSAEKPGREKLTAYYRELLDRANITWTRMPYHHQPPVIGPMITQWRMKRAAKRIVQGGGIRLLHCRSFPAALIGWQLKKAIGTRYIFDFRDFYADGGLVKFSGLKRLAFKKLKALEGPMIRAADGIVCLTERASDILRDWYLDDSPSTLNRFAIIPCCADFTHFDPAQLNSAALQRARAHANLPDDAFTLLYLGSLGADYLLPEMLRLFAQLLTLRPNAYFLFVSNNGRELVEAEARMQGLPLDRLRFVSVDRQDVPPMIALAQLSVVFIRADISKAGCSPTKLAELFAMDVPVVANSGVGDLDRLIDLDINGSVTITDMSDAGLRQALQAVISRSLSPGMIRKQSRHFDVPQGVDAYAKLYSRLLENA